MAENIVCTVEELDALEGSRAWGAIRKSFERRMASNAKVVMENLAGGNEDLVMKIANRTMKTLLDHPARLRVALETEQFTKEKQDDGRSE
jgi:hypothetical protein